MSACLLQWATKETHVLRKFIVSVDLRPSWYECEMIPSVCKHGPQQVVLFWEILGPLGEGALMEEVGSWESRY